MDGYVLLFLGEIAYNFIKEKPLVGKEKESKKPTSKILLILKVFKRFAPT